MLFFLFMKLNGLITQPWRRRCTLQIHKSIPHAAAPARNLDAAIPLRSEETETHNTIELQHTTVEHFALMHQFQCTKCLITCKAQKHSINKEEKKSPGTVSDIARTCQARFHGKATTPKTVAHASLLFSAAEPPFTRKNHNVSCKS